MKYIEKQASLPDFLEQWKTRKSRQLSGKSGLEQWEVFKRNRANQQLRVFITKEQGYICAYCNRRIHAGEPEDDEQTRLDHLMPKGSYPDRTFDYYNIVASCFGNERAIKPREVHCESEKGGLELLEVLFPTNPMCESQFVVTQEGRLEAEAPSIQSAIDQILNLNHHKLINLRKNALAKFTDEIPEQAEIEGLIQKYEQWDEERRYEPFSGIIINFLRQYISA